MGSAEAVAIITYRKNRRNRKWVIGCHLYLDNEETLKNHLKRCEPDATFIKAKIEPIVRRTKKT